MTHSGRDLSTEPTARSRYPGTRPFSDSPNDYARFFGRAEEGDELFLRVLSVPFLVQFGRSGLGKTSLLQAWLFPRLREKPFVPIMIRLNVPGEALTLAIARAIRESCKAAGLEHTEGQTQGLWELLSTTAIWRDDLLLTPVLVFDQFEEVFTLRTAAFRADVAQELGAVATGIAPGRLRAIRAATGERAVPPSVKIIISLREDFLGQLQEFSAAIPALFHERLRLEPLSEEAARQAITGPAELVAAPGEEPYWSPSFTFAPAALDNMVAYLKGNSGVIEPFQLQLLCRHAEAIAHDRAGGRSEPITLTTADFKGDQGFASILGNFYRDTLRKLPRPQRKRAKRLCEEGLLGASGHRLMLEEGQIRDQFGLKPETLSMLSQERVVRRERRLDSAFYEISHDRLAESIFTARRFRLPATAKRLLWAAGFVALMVVGGSFWITRTAETARLRAESARQDAEDLVRLSLFTLRDELQAIDKLDLLEQITRESLAYLDRQAADSDSPSVARNRSVALTTMGDLLSSRGNAREALDNYRQAVEIDERLLAGDPDNAQTREDAGIAYGRVGGALEAANDQKGALAAYTKASEFWTRLMRDDPDTAQWKYRLGLTHMSLGTVHLALEDAPAAAQSFREALAIAEQLTSADPRDPPSLNLVGDAHIRIGDALNAARDEKGALASYQRAVTFAQRRTADDPKDDQSRRQLVSSHVALGDFLVAQKPASALQSYREARAVVDPLVKANPRSVEARDQLFSIGDGFARAGDPQTALGTYSTALQVAERLLADNPASIDAKNGVSWCLVLVARAHLTLRQSEEAGTALERAVSIMKPIVESDSDPNYLDTYAQALLMLGRTEEARPVVSELLAKGWKDPTFLGLSRKSGLL